MLYDTFFSRCALPAAAAGLLWLGSLCGFAQEMEEDFSSTDLTGWTSSAGDWQVAEDEPSRVVSPSEQSILAGGENSWENYTVTTRLRLQEGRTAGLVFRYQDPENYYACVFTPMDETYIDAFDRRNDFTIGEGQIRFIRVLNGEKDYLVNYPCPIESGEWIDLRVEVRGPQMSAQINGEHMLYMENIELPTGGVGMFSGPETVVEFDSIQAAPADAPGPDPALTDFTPNSYRQGVLLNGMWDFSADTVDPRKMRVPDSFGRVSAVPNDLEEVVYERTFDIPADFGSVVKLEFESVVDFADVYVNDEMIGTHRGEWIAFDFDISEHVDIPSTGNTLKVVVRQGGEEWKYWPHGWTKRQAGEGGITGDVWLKGYSPVFIEDVFPKPSVRNQNITFETTLRNTTDQPVTVAVQSRVTHDGEIAKEFAPEDGVTIPANDATTISFTRDWADATLWWPGEPFLYDLEMAVVSSTGTTLDVKDDVRIGFREYWRDEQVYMLNGVEWDTYGDNIVEHGARVNERTLNARDASYFEFWSTKDRAREHMRRYMDGNIYWIRFHMGPPPLHVVEAADEVGMGVLLESSFYQNGSYAEGLNNPDALSPSGTTIRENFLEWSRQCVEMFRNNPSILKWSYTNEGFARFEFVSQPYYDYDGTRPVGCDDAETPDEYGRQYSYNEAGGNLWNYNVGGATGDRCRSIGEYSWPLRYVKGTDSVASKMLEFGLVTRGLRYAEFDDMRAYRMTPIMAERNKAYRKYEEAFEMAKRGMSRVLVADKEYDKLGRLRTPPILPASSQVARTLIVFNDDYQDGEDVLVEWEARTPEAVADSGSFTVTLEKGTHTEQTITFTTPETADGTPLQLVVKASKNGTPKYLDDQWYQFQIGENGHGTSVVMGGSAPASGDVPEGFDNMSTLLTYSGNWRHEQDSQYLGNTKSVTNSAGASVSFDFEGSSLAVYAKTDTSLGSFRIFIDGELKETVSTQGQEAFQQKVYEIEGLDASSHAVRLEVVGDGWIGLDFFGLDL